MNICEHLSATARLFPQRDAICFEDQRFTYAELDRLSSLAAQQLLAAGTARGDRVAIMLSNVPAFPVWYYAALRIGAIAVSISTRLTESEVSFILGDCGSKILITDEETLNRLRNQLSEFSQTSISTSDCGRSCNGRPLDGDSVDSTTVETENSKCGIGDWVDCGPSDPALILYTSGTTGAAKGATLSHGNVRSNVHAFNHLCNMQTRDRILLSVPLFHCFGQNALLNSAFNVGATLIMQRRFELNEAKQLISHQRVTQLYGVPMMFQLFLESCEPSDLESVTYCFSAAATLPIQVSARWENKFNMPINEGYGLTETSPFASYNHRLQFNRGSIGTPIDSVEMKIVDTETGRPCGPGKPGEIAIRGPNVMLGYWNREADNRRAIRDGWFHSGDIGRVDEKGYFYIIDRVKDMIAVGGLKVFPAEVERVLRDHADVSEVAVVGFPESLTGEKVVGFVVLRQQSPADSAQLASIMQWARSRLADYKVPRVLVPIEGLPRNAAGKVLKTKLREFDLSDVVDQLPIDGSPITPQREPTLRHMLKTTHASDRLRSTNQFLCDLVQQVAQSDQPPDADMRFIDAGLDSLMIVDLSSQLQAEVGSGQEISATMIFDYPRICDLAEFLVKVILEQPPSVDDDPAADTVREEDLERKIASLSEEQAEAELLRELES